MSETASHIVRRSVIEPEKRWAVSDGSLTCVSAKANETVAFKDVIAIRLQWSPNRFDLSRFFCEVMCRDGREYHIPSTHYRGFGDFEDRRETYRGLVKQLAPLVAEENPACVFHSGPTVSIYVLNIVALALGAAALIGVLFLVGSIWVGLIGALAILRLVTLPWAIAWFWTNRPKQQVLAQALKQGVVENCLPSTAVGPVRQP